MDRGAVKGRWLARNALTVVTALLSITAVLAALGGSTAGAAIAIAAALVSAAVQIRLVDASHERSQRATRRVSGFVRGILEPPLRTASREVYADQRWAGTETIEDLADGTHAGHGNMPEGHRQRWMAIADSLQERRDAIVAAASGDEADASPDARRALADVLRGLDTGSRCAREMTRHVAEQIDRIARLQDDPMAWTAATKVLEEPRARSYADFRAALHAVLKAQQVLESIARR